MPLKRISVVGACDQEVRAKEEKGAIVPVLVRTYHWLRSSGVARNGASPITKTRFTRPRSTKSLT